MKNSVDPDQKPADLDLHCLKIGYIRVSHPWVSCVNNKSILFVLMHYVPVNNFQSCQDDFLSSWVEPVLIKQRIKCLNSSRTQHSDSSGGETRTSNASIPSLFNALLIEPQKMYK